MLFINQAVSYHTDLKGCTKTMSCHGDCWGLSRIFEAVLSGWSYCICFISVGQKLKNPFWMGFLTLIFTLSVQLSNWPCEGHCERTHAHKFSFYHELPISLEFKCDPKITKAKSDTQIEVKLSINRYIISQGRYTWFSCVLYYFVYIIFLIVYKWFIHRCLSGFLRWHWDNHMPAPIPVK